VKTEIFEEMSVIRWENSMPVVDKIHVRRSGALPERLGNRKYVTIIWGVNSGFFRTEEEDGDRE
jgi:hypothetical protein